jgi:hypothetical protein
MDYGAKTFNSPGRAYRKLLLMLTVRYASRGGSIFNRMNGPFLIHLECGVMSGWKIMSTLSWATIIFPSYDARSSVQI